MGDSPCGFDNCFQRLFKIVADEGEDCGACFCTCCRDDLKKHWLTRQTQAHQFYDLFLCNKYLIQCPL